MSEKPSYIGLLNAIAVGREPGRVLPERLGGHDPRDDVRQVLTTIALREGEHGKAFAKRMCELGYTVLERDQDKAAERMAIAASTTLTDREKFEKLGLTTLVDESKPDIFSSMFNDKSIDIQTGALLGRYIAEERDSGRMFQDCYSQLCAAETNGLARTPPTSAPAWGASSSSWSSSSASSAEPLRGLRPGPHLPSGSLAVARPASPCVAITPACSEPTDHRRRRSRRPRT